MLMPIAVSFAIWPIAPIIFGAIIARPRAWHFVLFSYIAAIGQVAGLQYKARFLSPAILDGFLISNSLIAWFALSTLHAMALLSIAFLVGFYARRWIARACTLRRDKV